MSQHNRLGSLTSIALTAGLIFCGIATAEGRLIATPLKGNPAIAGWSDFLPVPTGIFFEVNGKKFYFGEYAQTGDTGIVFAGSKWEVKRNGQVIAHGYGQTPGWVVDSARRLFGF